MRIWILCALAGCGGDVGVATIEVTPAEATLIPLDTIRLAAVARDAGGQAVPGVPVGWTTSDAAIATVTAGEVTGLAPGEATITASAEGVAGHVRITVRDAPAVRWGHALVYDAARARVLLFGGSTGMTFHGDTWVWDGTRWGRLPVTGPSPRDQHVMAYDGTRGRVVLFGGRLADGSKAADTWEWDGVAWSERSSAGPPPREHHTAGFDVGRNRFVVHGGQSPTATLTDTWAWDGATWTERATTVPAPRQLPSRGTVYSAPRGTLLMTIGDLTAGMSELWEWDGSSWIAVADGGIDADSPLPLAETGTPGEALALDEGAARTWKWDGAAWTRVATTGPPPRFVSAMAYDAARAEVVLFGGSIPDGYLGDTWVWDGTAWHER